MDYDILIIGGGASGLMAAIAAARQKKRVAVLEQKDRIGKKLLATGNGKCNYTNLNQSLTCYRGENQLFIQEALACFGEQETLQFFLEQGIYPKIKNGYVYPQSEQAWAVLEVLRLELCKLHVELFTGCRVEKIISGKRQKGFQIFYQDTAKNSSVFQMITGEKVILSTGGKASPSFGSDGSGYPLAVSLGHRITDLAPGLIGLKGKENYFKTWSGIRIEAKICLFWNQKLLAEEMGELQLTHYGISGIPVFQLSRYAAILLAKGKSKITIVIDFLPHYSKEELLNQWNKRSDRYKKMEDFLIGLFPKKLIPVLLKKSHLSYQKKADALNPMEWNILCSVIKEFSLDINDSNGYENAQVTAGGVDTCDVDSVTMESKKQKGLYLTGELLDVDGICGGYNLQWAWTSGFLAGTNAAKSMNS